MSPDSTSPASAYGGAGWKPRVRSLKDELGQVWRDCGIANEWGQLKSVLVHRPGPEFEAIHDADEVQFLAIPDPEAARTQHDAVAWAFLDAGVEVHYLYPEVPPPPNQIFTADLFFMTPEGAILGRPASSIRAGEERHVARKLLELGVPILASVCGGGTFEGADAVWLNPETVLVASGFRTNLQGAGQVSEVLAWLGVRTIQIELPRSAMHLMGILRFADAGLAVAWPGRLSGEAIAALVHAGYHIEFLPDEGEAAIGNALNFVTLGPRRILVPAGNPITRAFYRSLGIECVDVEVAEIAKAAGAIGCLTGVLARAMD